MGCPMSRVLRETWARCSGQRRTQGDRERRTWRGFPDLASREPMRAKLCEGELWKRELENLLMPMIEKYEAVLVEDPEDLIHW